MKSNMNSREGILLRLRNARKPPVQKIVTRNVVQANSFSTTRKSLCDYFEAQATSAGASVERIKEESFLGNRLRELGFDMEEKRQKHSETFLAESDGGIAETGSVCFRSTGGKESADLYLCENLAVIQHSSTIYANQEDFWRDQKHVPRAVHIMTGPSRTADVEQRLQIGAHGPRSLHIFLIDDL